MRLLFDKCVALGLADILRALGHDVVFVQDIEPGADDSRVMGLAAAQDRLLVTVDKDFGELALRQRVLVPGVALGADHLGEKTSGWATSRPGSRRTGRPLGRKLHRYPGDENSHSSVAQEAPMTAWCLQRSAPK